MKSQLYTSIAAIMMVAIMIGSTFVVTAAVSTPGDKISTVYDWTDPVINAAGTYVDDVIHVNGTLTITGTGSLTLQNTTIIMYSNATFNSSIEVQNGGVLRLLDDGDGYTPMDIEDTDASVIRANDTLFPYFFSVNEGAHLDVDRSEIHNAGNVPVANAASLQGGSDPETDYLLWRTIRDGSFRVTINGFSFDINGIRFAYPYNNGIGSMANVANYIQNAIRDISRPDFTTASVVWDGTDFNITSGNADPFVSSYIEPLESTGLGTDISGINLRSAMVLGGTNGETDYWDWGAITNGTFRVTINGVTRDVGPINFSENMTGQWDQIQDTITKGLHDAGFTNAHASMAFYRHYICVDGDSTATISNLSAHSGGIGTDISGLTPSSGGQMWMDCADTAKIYAPDNTYWMDCASNATAYSYPAADITKAGIYIRSNLVNVEESLISENAYGLLFDSCLPETLLYNNITNNTGNGFSILNKATPSYSIDYELHDNVFADNFRAIQFKGQTITANVHDLNMSENGFGMEFFADTLLNADIYNNEIWLNNQSVPKDDHTTSTIFLLAGETGTINANVEWNNIVGNYRGGIWAGYQHGGMPSQNLNLLIANNTLRGNDGGQWFHASNILNAKIVDNFIGSLDDPTRLPNSVGDRFRIGYAADEAGSPGNLAAPVTTNIEVARNTFLYTDADGYVYVGGVFRVGGKDSIDMSFVDNEFTAIVAWNSVYLGGVMRLGRVPTGDDTAIVTDEINIDVSRNKFVFENNGQLGQYLDVGTLCTLHALINIDAKFNDNDVRAIARTGYIRGFSMIRADRTASETYEPDLPHGCDNVDVEVQRNIFDFKGIHTSYNVDCGGLFRFGGEFTTTAVFNDNMVNMVGYVSIGGLFQAGEIHNVLGKSKNTYVDVMRNTVNYLYDDDIGDGPDQGGNFLFNAWDNVDVEFVDNNIFSTYGAGTMLAINNGPSGVNSGSNLANFTTAIVRNNKFVYDVAECSSSGLGGIIKMAGNKTLTTVIDNNIFDISMSGHDVGGIMRLGYPDGRSSDPNPEWNMLDNLVADITNNDIMCVINNGDIGGVIRTFCNGTMDMNILNNDITIADTDDGSQFGHIIAVGFGDYDINGTSEEAKSEITNTKINGNNINAYYTDSTDGNGVSVRGDEIFMEMNDNTLTGYCADTDPQNVLGVRVGYVCEYNGILSNNVELSMSNNYLENTAVNAGIHVGALEDLDFSFNGGSVIGVKECDTYPGWGAKGHGISLEATNINAEITNAEFAYNRGSSIFVNASNDADVVIDNCNIHENGWHGIYLNSDSGRVTGTISETDIIDNTADIYGSFTNPDEFSGLYTNRATLDLINCTFDNPLSIYELELRNSTYVVALNTEFDDYKVLVETTQAQLFGGPDYEDSLPLWQAITDGQFRLTVNGTTRNIVGMNFTGVGSMAAVAAIITIQIQIEFPGVICSWDAVNGNFVITVPNKGLTSTIAPLANVAAVGTNISGLMMNASGNWWMDCADNATVVNGQESTLLVKWFMDVLTIHQASGVPLPGCAITVENVLGATVGTGTTGMDGHRSGFIVDEYYRTPYVWTNYTEHTVTATKGLATGIESEYMDASKTVVIFVDYISPLPVADAGEDQTVSQYVDVTFNGSASTDDVPPLVSYVWTFNDTFANITLNGMIATYNFTELGVYNVTLMVTDIFGDNSTDNMFVTVVDTYPPTANAGPDQTIDEDTLLTFNGTGSTDAIGVTNYTWTFTDGTEMVLYGVAPTYTFAQPGVYLVNLNVSDEAGNTAIDNMTVTVLDITEPVADAGADQTISEGDTVTFDAVASTDNVEIVTFEWTFNDGTNDVTLYGQTMDYTFPIIGSYEVTLVVFDEVGNSAADTMWVYVVDTTAPAVLVISPGDNLIGVPLNWSLVIVFTEPMNETSVEEAFVFSGSQVVSFVWDTTGTYVTVSFQGGLSEDTGYTFTIGANSTDVAGNALEAAYTGSFRTLAVESGDPIVQEPETNFFTDNWWILVVIIVVLAVLLLLQVIKGGSKPAEPAYEEPAPEYEEAPEPEYEDAPEPEYEDAPEPDAAPEPEVELEMSEEELVE